MGGTTILISSATLVSLYTILSLLEIIPKDGFTPAGNLLATAMFLSVITVYLLIYLLQQVYSIFTKHLPANFNSSSFFFNLLSFILITGTTILLVIQLNTNQKPLLLPFSVGWTIFVETLKSTKTLFLGVGPANFITAFTLAKPETINATPLWNIIFTSSSSFLLNLATEAGIVAGFLYIVICLKTIKLLLNTFSFTKRVRRGEELNIFWGEDENFVQSATNLPVIFSLIAALTLQIILSGNMALFILTIILLAFSCEKKEVFTINLSRLGKFIYLPLLVLLVLSVLSFYLIGRIYLAEMSFKASLDALLNNQGSQAYDFQDKAILLNPYLDRYRLVFSKTSLQLANALAGKDNLTDEDEQTIPILVKQAIEQAKRAVNLYQTNVVNWNHLGSTYASLVNFAQGADEFAIRSYGQKINLDPFNPSNYLTLGGLHLQLKNYQEAEDNFRKAVDLKPDFANAYYNLAVSLREQKKYKEAYNQLQATLVFLQPESADAKKVKEEIDDLFKLLPRDFSLPSPTPQSLSPQFQDIETEETSPSALENLPTLAPTISIPQPPIID